MKWGMVAVIPFVRTGPFLILGVVFGVLNFVRTWAFKQRTGISPWHIHPIFWGVFSLFISVIGTLLAAVAIATTKPPTRPTPGTRAPTGPPALGAVGPAEAAAGYRPGPFLGGPPALAHYPEAAPAPAPAPAAAPAGWQPDPSGKFQQRYWSGTAWTEHVANDGVASVDPVPPGANASRPAPPAPAAGSPVAGPAATSLPPFRPGPGGSPS
jgi:hypothetical protein